MGKISSMIWKSFENLLQRLVCKLFHLTIPEGTWDSWMQFIKFGVVGVTNTFIGYVIYVITLKGLRMINLWSDIDVYVAQFVMFLLSVAWSFYWNNKVVFKEDENEQRNLLFTLMKTYISYAFTSLILAEILLYLWVNIIGLNEFIAPILSLLITVPLNFIIQKFWAFRNI